MRVEISASELVQISLERIEELNPSLNAFVDVDEERGPWLRPRRSARAISARSPACRSAIKNKPPSGGTGASPTAAR